MESLRFSGYDNSIALADLVDNSLDADASLIDIKIEKNREDYRVSIADNGIGMSEDVLEQALKLGSLTSRDTQSDLGRFGMGLVTASISIGRRVVIYTKEEGQDMLTGIMDLDYMAEVNDFKVYREKSSKEDMRIAAGYGLDKCGTVLIIEKCDQVNYTDINELSDRVSKYFGEVFREFLRAGKVITVNNSKVDIVDPMWQDGILVDEYKKRSELYSSEKFSIKVPNIGEEEIVVKIHVLPMFDQSINRKLKLNQTNQGFYLIRNHRQISGGETLNIFSKHNDLNRVRVEIFFPGTLDQAMGVNYSKHGVKPSQAVLDKLKNDVLPQIDTLRNRFRKIHSVEESEDLNFSDAEKAIAQSRKLLDVSDAKKEIPVKRTRKAREKEENKTPETDKHRGRPSLPEIAKFELHDFGSAGIIFDVEKQGKKTIILWNIAHPFYRRFILENKDNKDLLNAVSFLAYSMGEAKIKYSTNEDAYEMMDNIMVSMSANLRILLGS